MNMTRTKKADSTGGSGVNHRITYPGTSPKKKNFSLLKLGWIFLGIVILLSVVAIVFLLRPVRAAEAEIPEVVRPSDLYAPSVSAPAYKLPEEGHTDGRSVIIDRMDCSMVLPSELTLGVLKNADLSEIADDLVRNSTNAGWGGIGYSLSDDGSLLLYGTDVPALTPAQYEEQTAFLSSSRPENLARTFLDNCGLIGLLQRYDLFLSSNAENRDGEISFRGNGAAPQSECSVSFSFLYTGAFNQAKITAVFLDEAFVTQDILPPEKAASRAVSWTSSGTEKTQVTAAEIRYIRGIPFYAFSCADGTTAYAPAVTDEAIDSVPSVKAAYDTIMADGILEYVATPGVGF